MQNVTDKLIPEKVVILYLKVKLKIGKNHQIYKNVKNACLWFKKSQVVITCLALFADINGAGFVEQTILKLILVL